MRFAFISTEKVLYPVVALCCALGVTTSGYYAWLQRPKSSHAERDVTVQAPVESAGSAWHSARVQTKIEHLSRRIEVVVEEHLEACRLEAEAALKRAFGVSPRKAVRGGDRARSAKAENRRNSSELAMLRERLLQAVAAKPGETMTVLAVEAGSSARDLKFPMRQLKQARQVRSAGERGSTRYFPMVLPKSA